MAVFQVQKHFDYFVKETTSGKHCEHLDCKVKEKSHYHCKHCLLYFRGLQLWRMEKQLLKRHDNQGVNGAGQKLYLPCQNGSALKSTLKWSSLHRGVAIKKSKVSTPISSEPGVEIFSSPGFSPIHNKSAMYKKSSIVGNINPTASTPNFLVVMAIKVLKKVVLFQDAII